MGIVTLTCSIPIQIEILSRYYGTIPYATGLGVCTLANFAAICFICLLRKRIDLVYASLISPERKSTGNVTGAILKLMAVGAIQALIVSSLWQQFTHLRPAETPILPWINLSLVTFFALLVATHGYILSRSLGQLRSVASARPRCPCPQKLNQEIQLLRSRLDAHFLFNALQVMIVETGGNRRLLDSMQSLSGYLLYSLKNRDNAEVTFGEELEAVENLLEAEKVRFEQYLDVQIDVDPEAHEVMVPGVFLQPLVENAIKFGRRTVQEKLYLRIDVARTENFLRIQVSNTGKWFQPGLDRNSTSYGHEAIRRHLSIAYPGESNFRITPRGRWVVAEISIANIRTKPPK